MDEFGAGPQRAEDRVYAPKVNGFGKGSIAAFASKLAFYDDEGHVNDRIDRLDSLGQRRVAYIALDRTQSGMVIGEGALVVSDDLGYTRIGQEHGQQDPAEAPRRPGD